MADELDSGSSVGYYVWVQVPSSALYIREGLRRNPEVFSYIQTKASLVSKSSKSLLHFSRCRTEIHRISSAPSSGRKEEEIFCIEEK